MKTLEELSDILPSHINISSHPHEYTYGILHIIKNNDFWQVSYRFHGVAVCLNYKDDNPPYNNAIVHGKTLVEALNEMYKWLIENKLM